MWVVWKGISYLGIGWVVGIWLGFLCIFIVVCYWFGKMSLFLLDSNVNEGMFLFLYCNVDVDDSFVCYLKSFESSL